MKKIGKIVFFALALALCFSGCSSNSDPTESPFKDSHNDAGATCYLLSSSNSAFVADDSNPVAANGSIRWDGTSFTSESAAENMSIDFSGETYNGTYRNSRYDSYNSFATDYYDGDDGLVFGVNADNGKLVYLNLKTLSFFDLEPLLADIDNIEVDGVKIAEEYASQFIDVNSCTLIEPYVSPYQPDEAQDPTMMFYTYTYVKEINGENSSAYVSVQITSKGNLASVVVGDVDAFSQGSLTQINYYNDINIDELALGKMADVVNEEGIDSPTFNVQKKYYALTPTGEVVICVKATCTYYDVMNNEAAQQQTTVGFELMIMAQENSPE